MTLNEYLQRHDRVGQYIHWKIRQYYNAPCAKNWYEHKPQKVVETESASLMGFLYSYRQNNTSKKTTHNYQRSQRKTCKLIDLTFPMDINISAEEFEKISKNKDLQIEVERMRQLKASIIPIVVGALGSVKKGTTNHLETIPGKQNLERYKK